MENRIITYDDAGNVIEDKLLPLTQDDYIQAIKDIEYQFTDRRLRDAILTSEGRAWMNQKEEEIAELRAALNNL